MKYFSHFFSLLIVSVIFYSCCTQISCENAFDSKQIHLKNFTINESSEVVISSYNKGDDFNTLISSQVSSARTISGNSEGDLFVDINIEFSDEFEYIFFFTDINEEYRVTEITITVENCNDCFLAKDEYTSLESYKVNEVFYENSEFLIQK